MNHSFLPALVLLTIQTLSLTLSANEQGGYIISGQTYDRAEVERQLQIARTRYGVDPVSNEVRTLEQLKAKAVKGTVMRQTGKKMVVQTNAGEYIVIRPRQGANFKAGQNIELTLKLRGSNVKQRIDGNQFVSMKQYQDITLDVTDIINALNQGKDLQGVHLEAVQSRADRLRHEDRPETQFDRRTIKINRK